MIKRILLALCILLGIPLLAQANQNAQGWCEVGATPVITSGLTSTTQVQASYPTCTVTVFVHGGGVASIFSDNSGTPLANPFTADTTGRWLFYAANGRYDVQLSGGGFPTPVTYSDISLSDPANQQAALPNTNLSFSATPAFNATNNVSYTMTLTGNVTSSTITGTPANGNLLSFTLVEDAVGGRTFAFPGNFILPLGFSFSVLPLATNALTFKYDGTNWNLISNSGSGGGGSSAQPPQGSMQVDNSGALAGTQFIYAAADTSGRACNTQACALLAISVDSAISLESLDGNNSIEMSVQSDVAPPGGVSQAGATLSTIAFITHGAQALPNISSTQIGGTTLGGSCYLSSPSTPPCGNAYQALFGDAIGDTANGQDAVGFTAWAAMNKSAGHNMNSVTGFLVRTPGNFTTSLAPVVESAVNLWGLEIQDIQGLGTTMSAGIHMETQTNPSSHNYAIRLETGAGPSILTDSVSSTFFSSLASNPAASGFLRLATGDSECWRNQANSIDRCLSKNASDNLVWPTNLSVNGTLLVGTGGQATFPNNTGNVAELNFVETWTAAQTHNSGTLILAGSGSGTTILNAATVAGATTATLPANTGTIAELNFAQAWTAAQTFSPAIAVGSGGTGSTTFTTNGILYGNGSSAVLSSAAGAGGTFCLTETNGGVPTFGSCAGSAATAWSSLTNPSADLSLSMGTNNSLFTSGVMVGTRNAWEFLDGNSTSTGSLASFHTGATSTMKPFTATAQGTANGVQMSTAGILAPIGTGGITANAFSGILPVANGGSGASSFTANQLLYGNGASAFAPLIGSLIGTNPVLTLTSAAISNVVFALNTPASPTADIFDLNINGVKTAWFDNLAILHTPQTTYNGSGPLTLSGNGGTCPSPAAGLYSICIADLASGTIQTSLNNAAYKPLPQWINTAPIAHGVVLVGSIFPQQSSTAAGTAGQSLVSQGAAADPVFGNVNVAGGGTGVGTLAAHGVLVGEGTSNVVVVGPAATAHTYLASAGVGADPVFEAIPLGNSNAVSGILPIANGGTGASSLAAASIVTVTGVITANDCAKFSSATVVTDSGAPCGGAGGASRLDQITAATGSNTINSTIFPQAWNWALTGSTTAFKRGENSAATGANNIIDQVTTAAGSTATVSQWDNNGVGYQVNSIGMLRPVSTGAFATRGAAHNLVVSQGSSTEITYIPPVTAGKVLIDNGPGNDPSFQDPIISQAYVNLWTTQDVTTTRTSAAVRNPVFSQTGTLQFTWASITGSPATCTLQIQGVDSVGNALNNGSTFSVSPANGTSSQTFTAAATLQTAAQIKAIFVCGTYPTTGTLTLDYTPIPNMNVTNTVTVAGTVTTTPPANASANVAQFGGTNVVTGTGASGSGIPRFTISNDSSLAANQSVNTSQINGVTPLMNNGVSGTGSQRINIASDNSAIANWGLGATGSTVPTGGQYIAGNGSGNLTGIISCDNSTAVNMVTATTTQIIAISGTGGRTYICSIDLVAGGADNVALISGSGSNCASNQAGLAGGVTAATGWNFAANGGLTKGSGLGMVYKTVTTNNEVCLVTSAAVQLSGSITWTQF